MTPQGIWLGAAGVDGPDGRLATAQDVFAIASISKMFTAVLMMRLADEGKIDLDNPLSDYLGQWGDQANGATVRQALGMRSGIADTAEASIAKVIAAPERVWTADEVVAEFPNPSPKLVLSTTIRIRRTSFLIWQRSMSPGPACPRRYVPRCSIRPVCQPPRSCRAPTRRRRSRGRYQRSPAISTSPSMELAGRCRRLLMQRSRAAAGMASDAPSLASWGWQLFAGKIVSAESLAAMTTIGQGGSASVSKA